MRELIKNENVMNINEACVFLGVQKWKLYDLINKGLPYKKFGNAYMFFKPNIEIWQDNYVEEIKDSHVSCNSLLKLKQYEIIPTIIRITEGTFREYIAKKYKRYKYDISIKTNIGSIRIQRRGFRSIEIAKKDIEYIVKNLFKTNTEQHLNDCNSAISSLFDMFEKEN